MLSQEEPLAAAVSKETAKPQRNAKVAKGSYALELSQIIQPLESRLNLTA